MLLIPTLNKISFFFLKQPTKTPGLEQSGWWNFKEKDLVEDMEKKKDSESERKAREERKAKSFYEAKQWVENEGMSPACAEDSGHSFSQTYPCFQTHSHLCTKTHA